jgi:hypothetical protein
MSSRSLTCSTARPQNDLLAVLFDEDFRQLRPHLKKTVSLDPKQV